MDSEEAMINKLKVQKVTHTHTAVFLEKCVTVHRCDSECSLAVGASALSLCRAMDETDEGFCVIKVSRPVIVSLSLPCSKRVAMSSQANCTECTLI